MSALNEMVRLNGDPPPVAPDMNIIPRGAVSTDGRAVLDTVDLYRTFTSEVRFALRLLCDGAQLVHTQAGWRFAQERGGDIAWHDLRITETTLHTIVRYAAGLIIEPEAGRCWLPSLSRAAVADKLAQTMPLTPHAVSVQSLGGFLKPKTRSMFLSALLWCGAVDCARVFNSMDDKRVLTLLLEKADAGNVMCNDVLRTAGLRNWGRSVHGFFEMRKPGGDDCVGHVRVAVNAQVLQSMSQAMKLWQRENGAIHLNIETFEVFGDSLPNASLLRAEWVLLPQSEHEAELFVTLRRQADALAGDESTGQGVSSARTTLSRLREHWQGHAHMLRIGWLEASNDSSMQAQANPAASAFVAAGGAR